MPVTLFFYMKFHHHHHHHHHHHRHRHRHRHRHHHHHHHHHLVRTEQRMPSSTFTLELLGAARLCLFWRQALLPQCKVLKWPNHKANLSPACEWEEEDVRQQGARSQTRPPHSTGIYYHRRNGRWMQEVSQWTGWTFINQERRRLYFYNVMDSRQTLIHPPEVCAVVRERLTLYAKSFAEHYRQRLWNR